MKKTLALAIAVIAVLSAAAYLLLSRLGGIQDPAQLLPEGTVLVAGLQDLPRTIHRWPTTELARLSAEPEISAFLEKPLGRLTSDPGYAEASGLLSDLKPARIFIAITGVSPDRVEWIVGFQFWGGEAARQKAVDRLKKELVGAAPLPASEPLPGGLHRSILPGLSLYEGVEGKWGFLSNAEAPLRDALSRAAGKSAGVPLSASERYRTVKARMVPDPDFLFFAQPESAIDALLKVGSSLGATPIPGQTENIKRAKAIGYSFTLEGDNALDRLFVLAAISGPPPKLDHAGMRFADASAVAAFEFLVNVSAPSSTNALTALLAAPLHSLAAAGADVGLLPRAFGRDFTLVAHWPEGALKPAPLLAIPILDRPLAEKWLTSALGSLVPQFEISGGKDGLTRLRVPSLQTPLADPTAIITPSFLLLGLDPDEVVRASGVKETAGALETSAKFKPALPAYRAANEAFGFIDTAAVVGHAYNFLKPVILFGVAVNPDAAQFIDTSKLPATDVLTRHLGPLVYSQQSSPDGVLIESSGPITMNQAALLIAAGAAYGAPRPAR